ncbi:unnamed protein product [Rotaria sp. Silwood1]|nr:unnamed protein product [Rotaria sp. Silwood1]CAF1652841.1 unnamed protein product [Rotaria sp. Silwood1]CAF3922337.1 unnamed protein product [Rotaria sp. Silwood1]CAF5024025.1 unnamed protein product [Rotaria sp. Silwood1]
MPTIWCANSLTHDDKTKMGQKPNFPKGQRRLNHNLATFLTNISSLSFTENDYLCTPCYQRSMEKFNEMYICINSPPAMETDEPRPTRTAATTALSNIATLNTFDMFLSDQNKSSDILDDEIMDIEFLVNRENSLALLNKFFSLVGLSSVRDIRNQNILRQKVNLGIIVIRKAAEELYKENQEKEEIIKSNNKSDITINDVNELVTNFQLLVNMSDYAEQIRLLTLVPKAWGRVKTSTFFGCTDHQARYGIYLRDADQVLSYPIDCRGNLPFDPFIEQTVFNFYHTDEISKASPNKKDVLQNNKNPKPIRFMLMSLREAYQIFIQENPTMHVGKSKFCSIKPKWIKTTTPHDSCVCEHHQNPELLLNVMNRLISFRLTLSSLVEMMVCQNSTVDCFLRQCSTCNTKMPSIYFIELLQINGTNEDDDITWVLWEKNEKKTELQRHTTSISTLLDKLDCLWNKFLIHYFVTIEQREYIKQIKLISSEHGTAIVQLDFAENFCLFSQSAVQSSYYYNKQVTIFTVHIKMGLGHRNLVFISDYMKHTTEFVYQAQMDFGIAASWTFSSTSHGKGPVDGVGAAVKSRATRYLLKGSTEQVFLSAEEFFRFTHQANDHQVMKGDLEPNRPIEAFYIKSSDIDFIFKRTLQKRWACLERTNWIEGIQSKHQFDPVGVGNIKCRRTSSDSYSETFELF